MKRERKKRSVQHVRIAASVSISKHDDLNSNRQRCFYEKITSIYTRRLATYYIYSMNVPTVGQMKNSISNFAFVVTSFVHSPVKNEMKICVHVSCVVLYILN